MRPRAAVAPSRAPSSSAGESTASFYYGDTKAGTPALTAADTALSSSPTQTETVNPAAADALVVTTSFANPTPAGTAGTVTVTAMDKYNNVVNTGPSQYEGTVDLSSTDSRITGLPATHTFTAGDAGSHTFTQVVLKTAGNRVITATDSVTRTITGGTTLVVTGTTSTSATGTSAPFSPTGQTVLLSATVTSAAGTVDEGTETFTISSGMTVIGSAVTVNVTNGTASASYPLPAGTSPGTFAIHAVYNGTADFRGSTDTSHSLNVSAPPTPTIIGEQIQTNYHMNKKGKPVGKPLSVVVTLDFSAPMYPPSAVSIANYQVDFEDHQGREEEERPSAQAGHLQAGL